MSTNRQTKIKKKEPIKDEEILEGFINTYFNLDDSISRIYQASTNLYTLIELLMEKGIINKSEFEKRKKGIEKQTIESYKKAGIGILLHDHAWTDKYQLTNDAKIDCQSRMHICKAVCCRFTYCLSIQDVHEGIRWNLSKPFTSMIGDNGYCIYFKEKKMKCSIYEQRPLGCRLFDCRTDQRIWLDFDKKIIRPNVYVETVKA